MENDIRQILNMVERGQMSVDDALLKIKTAPFEDLGYAKVDLHRKVRQGVQEVIYGAGKSAEQIAGIVKSLLDNDQDKILITRIDSEKYESMSALLGEYRNERRIEYNKAAEIAFIGIPKVADGIGKIVVATGGTSDMKVAEEAAFTAEHMGNEVVRLYDVGVSGIHRLLAHNEELMSASVIIAIAGMEGALASVIGGLADCPVIAVPTSVGYGAAFEGLTALLSMLNSCASGVSVVNIDNGFGAGYLAHMINHMSSYSDKDSSADMGLCFDKDSSVDIGLCVDKDSSADMSSYSDKDSSADMGLCFDKDSSVDIGSCSETEDK